MKTRLDIYLAAFLLLVLFSFTPIYSQTSISGDLNISELLKSADKTFNLSEQDAVILFDGHTEEWLIDGRLKTSVHRIVWLGGASVVRRYGDHRIPYDDKFHNFSVQALRTWRDNRWWDSDTTGIVETLPHAVQKAYDYSNMREMMLLHNGIELPCIIEVAYTIEDKFPHRSGVEGMWLFARDDPVLVSQCCLSFPSERNPQLYASKDVTDPIVDIDESSDMETYTYRLEGIPALPLPHTADPAAYSPHVAWSTWKNWQQYGDLLKTTFDSWLEMDKTLRDSLNALVDRAYALTDKAKRIAAFVDRTTRYINYPARYWQWNPRYAYRTYNTAYGHRLDRVILAASLFKEAGFMIFPVFRGIGYGDINEDIPTLSRMDDIGLWVEGGDEVSGYYDPTGSRFHNGLHPIFGRTVWFPGNENDPQVTWRGESTESLLEIRIDIEYDSKEKNWHGKGLYKATHGFNPHDRMEGTDTEAKDFLGSVISGVIKEAELSGYNPIAFNRFTITTGFEFTAPLGDEDEYGRYILTIDDPDGGIFDMLPNDVRLHIENRDSPTRLPGLMEQIISVSLDTSGCELVYIPEGHLVDNDMGSSQITRENKDKQINITRRLVLNKVDCAPSEWTLLRSLLLADKNERGRLVIMKLNDDNKLQGSE